MYGKFNVTDELSKFVNALNRDEDVCKACQKCHFAPASASVAKAALNYYKQSSETEDKRTRNDEVRWLETLYTLKDPRN